MNAPDGVGEEGGDGQHLDNWQLLVGWNGNAVGDHDLSERRVPQTLDGVSAQHTMRGTGVNGDGAIALGHVGRRDDATGRRDHVVENDRNFAFERSADQVHRLDVGGTGAALVHDGDGAAYFLLVEERSLDAAFVRAKDDDIL